ncbi:MAG: PAS domain-containing protein [Rubrivivax sp.]|nr:PAS domain-containing protein [Rubrivivax sp.]
MHCDGDAQSEYRFGRADGSWFWVNDQMRIERDSDGSPLRIIGSWTDITERHAAQQALEQKVSHLRFRSTFNRPRWASHSDLHHRPLDRLQRAHVPGSATHGMN